MVDDTLDGENNLEKKTREVSKFMVVSHPRWRKFQLNWYTPMSATSLVFFSRFFSPSTAPSTNNTHEQKLGKWDISGRDLKKYANCQITMCLKLQKMDDFSYCLPYLLQLPHIVPDGRSSQIQFPNRWWYWSLRFSPRQSDMAENVWQKRFRQPVECGRKKPISFSNLLKNDNKKTIPPSSDPFEEQACWLSVLSSSSCSALWCRTRLALFE